MSDLSVGRQRNIANPQLNDTGRSDLGSVPLAGSGTSSDALALHDELLHGMVQENNPGYTAQIDRLLQEISSKLAEGRGDSKLEARSKLFFLTHTQSESIRKLYHTKAPHLAALQKNALECDRAYQEKCLALFTDLDSYKKVGLAYKTTATSSERAFLDLGVAFSLTCDFMFGFAKETKTQFSALQIQTLQMLVGELIAADSESIDGSVKQLESFLTEFTRDKAGLHSSELAMFKARIGTIAEQKARAVSELKAQYQDYKNAFLKLKTLNPESLKLTALSYKNNAIAHGIPSACGIQSVLNDHGSLQALQDELKEHFKPQVDALLQLHQDLALTLKSQNFRGQSLTNLYTRLKAEGSGNSFLTQKLEALSKSAFEEMGKRVIDLLEHPVSNANLAAELSQIGEAMGTKMLPQHSQALAKIVSLNLSKLPLNQGGLQESTNLKALKSLMQQISSSESLQRNFGEVMDLLSLNRFDLTALASLQAGSENLTDEQVSQQSLSLINSLNRVMSGAEDGNALIDQLAEHQDGLKQHHEAFSAVAVILSKSQDEKLIQQCGRYLNLPLIKQAARLDLQHHDLREWPQPPSAQELADHPEEYQDYLVRQALDEVALGNRVKFSPQTLKTLLHAGVTGKLPYLGKIWNTVLNCAYHAEMSEKLNSGEIRDVPKQIYSLSTYAAAPAQDYKPAPSSGERARREFETSLSSEVREQMKARSLGLLRQHKQVRDLKAITNNLNQLQGQDVLEAISHESSAGKRLLSLNEMRQELTLLSSTLLKKGTHALDHLTDEQTLLRTAVDKGSLVNALNLKYSGISKQYQELILRQDLALGNPQLAFLQEAQQLAPTQLPKGEEVAVTLVTLRDQLLDDLSLVDDASLSRLGFNDPAVLKFTSAELDYGKRLNAHLARQHLLDLNGIRPQDNTGAEFSPAKVAAFEQKCDEALAELRDRIATEVRHAPLTRLGKLMVKKYLQLNLLRHGDSYTQFIAKDKGTALLLEKGDSPEVIKQAQTLTFEENVALNSQLTTLLGGDFTSTDPSLIRLRQLAVNDLCQSLGLDEDLAVAMNESLTERPLDDQGKQELVNSLKLLHLNVDPDTFIVSDPRDTTRSAFSSDLLNLARAPAGEFHAQLQHFVSQYLLGECTSRADAFLTYVKHQGDAQQAALGALQSAFEQDSLSQSSPLQAVKESFTRNYGAKLGSSREGMAALSQAQSEQISKVGAELLGKSSIRSLLRLSASYAAAKLGFAGRADLIRSYQEGSISAEERAQVVETMKEALRERGLDENLSEMLVRARLGQNKSSHILARTWSYLKQSFYSAVQTAEDFYVRKTENFLTRKLRLTQNYVSYLPAVTEMVKALGKDNLKYLDTNKEFKFNFKPLAAIDKVTGSGLADNGVVTLKLSLALLNNRGMVLERGEDGKVRLCLNTKTLFGAKAIADVDLLEASGASVELGGKAGLGRLLNLKFDRDEEAAVFLCKMFTGQLNEDDVRLASDAAVGSGLAGGVSAEAGAKLGDLAKWRIYGDEIATNAQLPGVDPDEKFAQDHPVVNNIMETFDLGEAKLSAGFEREDLHLIDNSGILHQTHRQWELGASFTSVAVVAERQAAGDLIVSGAQKVSDLPEKAGAGLESVDSKVSDLLNAPIKLLGIGHAECIHQVHVSDLTGAVDYATDTTISNVLTAKDLKRLRREGLLNEALEQKLTEACNAGNIVKVSYEMKLKQSVIRQYQHDPKQLAKAAEQVKRNYELASFSVELQDTDHSVKNFNLASLLTMNTFSYESQTTARGTTLLRVVNHRL